MLCINKISVSGICDTVNEFYNYKNFLERECGCTTLSYMLEETYKEKMVFELEYQINKPLDVFEQGLVI